jgi:hypothetical protein
LTVFGCCVCFFIACYNVRIHISFVNLTFL